MGGNGGPGTHILSVRSLLPEATLSPCGDQSSANTSSAWPGSVYSAFPPALPRFSFLSWGVLAAHTLTVLSRLPVARKRLSGDQHTWYTAPTCPCSVTKNLVNKA